MNQEGPVALAAPTEPQPETPWPLLALFARLAGAPLEPRAMRSDPAGQVKKLTLAESARALSRMGLAVQPRRGSLARFAKDQRAVLTQDLSGKLLIISPTGKGQFLVQATGESAPIRMDAKSVGLLWSGEWLVAARAAAATGASGEAKAMTPAS